MDAHPTLHQKRRQNHAATNAQHAGRKAADGADS